MDLDECIRKGFIKKTRVNRELVKSLIEMSDLRETVVRKARLDEKNISVYVSMAYDSLREVLESICILHGYKVTSHVCIGELMKTLVNDFDFERFDRFRYTRNSINYYGRKIDFGQGKELIQKMLMMKARLLKTAVINIK